jgi:hypothetical protein
MARKYREYKFKIDAFTPETMPMTRLLEYLHDLGKMFGEEKSVHFLRVEHGSTVPILSIEREAEPKVRARLRAVRHKEAPEDAMKAATQLNDRLAMDNATGELLDPAGAKLMAFPGRDRALSLEYGPFSQAGTLQGIPIKVGGENDPVPIHLEDGTNKHICWVKRTLAKEIAAHLFTCAIRVEGTGRWIRHADGEWELIHFIAHSYAVLQDSGGLRNTLNNLRAIPAEWKNLEDPIAELERLRNPDKVH